MFTDIQISIHKNIYLILEFIKFIIPKKWLLDSKKYPVVMKDKVSFSEIASHISMYAYTNCEFKVY